MIFSHNYNLSQNQIFKIITNPAFNPVCAKTAVNIPLSLNEVINLPTNTNTREKQIAIQN